ncbi:hypothetical protein ACS0TY_002144 [Phlomoides rotata]
MDRDRQHDALSDVLDLGDIPNPRAVRGVVRSVALVGRLCLVKSVNVFALMEVMNKGFRPKGKLSSRDWGNGLVLFTFELLEDMEWVLRNQPWHFDGALFVIKALDGSKQSSMIQLSLASFWVRAYDLPLDLHSERVLKLIAVKVGVLECFESVVDGEPAGWLRFKECKFFDRDETLGSDELSFGLVLKAALIRRGRGMKPEVVYVERMGMHGLISEGVHVDGSPVAPMQGINANVGFSYSPHIVPRVSLSSPISSSSIPPFVTPPSPLGFPSPSQNLVSSQPSRSRSELSLIQSRPVQPMSAPGACLLVSQCVSQICSPPPVSNLTTNSLSVQIHFQAQFTIESVSPVATIPIERVFATLRAHLSDVANLSEALGASVSLSNRIPVDSGSSVQAPADCVVDGLEEQQGGPQVEPGRCMAWKRAARERGSRLVENLLREACTLGKRRRDGAVILEKLEDGEGQHINKKDKLDGASAATAVEQSCRTHELYKMELSGAWEPPKSSCSTESYSF